MAAKKKKPKVGSLGPQPHWMRMSVADRARTKQYIKAGFYGHYLSDGTQIPGIRRIYTKFDAKNGFDLRHIERWSSARLKSARSHIQKLNTLTGRPFAIVIPRTTKQRKAAQKFTGQDLARQKEYIVTVQDPKRDKVVFRNNQVAVERTFPKGSKTIKQRFLFSDYLQAGESQPTSFLRMREVTMRMLPDMPENYRGEWVYYTLLTVQYGPVGESVPKQDVLTLLRNYHERYDPAGQHKGFAETVIGFQMVGTYTSAAAYQTLRSQQKERRKREKLIFSKAMGKAIKGKRK
jgi:hypothetical protein